MLGQLSRTVLIALLVGLVSSPLAALIAPWFPWLLACLSLVAQMAWQLRHFTRLEHWSRDPNESVSLEGEGAWDKVFGRLYRHEREMRRQISSHRDAFGRAVAALQALNDGVVLLDNNNQIVFCNETAEAQLGLSLQTDRGQPVINLVRSPELSTYFRDGEFSRPLTLRSERNEDRVLSIYVLPYAGDRRLMQIKDVTQADLLDRMRRDFVANVSHELRTPLTVLAGFLETLQEIEVDRDEQKRYLDMMAQQSQRMQSIVKDLLTLSAIESAPPPADEVVDMVNLIDKLRRDAEALSAGRHQIVVDGDGQCDLRGSEPELVSAFSNLVANAVRYTPAGGMVRITWRCTSQGAEFAVEDTGIGIEAKHIPRLTERFYRVDRGRSRDAGGTGLGLAIVKHSLSRHQAQLEITSTPGKGSRFAALFPPGRLLGV